MNVNDIYVIMYLSLHCIYVHSHISHILIYCLFPSYFTGMHHYLDPTQCTGLGGESLVSLHAP